VTVDELDGGGLRSEDVRIELGGGFWAGENGWMEAVLNWKL